MDTIPAILLTALLGAIAWTARFAITEYKVFKSLKIPTKIIKEGFYPIAILTFWNVSTNYIYSKMLPFVPVDKISEMNKTIFFRENKFFIFFLLGLWIFIWFIAVSIDKIAESINEARTKHND